MVSPAVHADGDTIHLTVHGDLSIDALRVALAHDTKRPVVVDDGATGDGPHITVTLRAAGDSREIVVTFESTHGSLTRTIPAPAETATALINDASLLAASLSVDIELGTAPAPVADQPLLPPPPLPPPEQPPPPPVVVAAALPPTPVEFVPDRALTFPASASFFYPLAANFAHPGVRTFFDLNVLYGRYGEIDGGQIGTASVIARDEGASGELHGVQIGGILAYAVGAAQGLQIGGVFTSAESVEGIQIGGVVNHSEGNVDGAQIGLINLAGGRVRGAQIGLINVADDIDGPAIGLASVTRTGGVHPVAWSSTTTYANAGVKFATKHTYTMLSAHATYFDNQDFYGAGFAIGGHAPITKLLYVDFDVGLNALLTPKSSEVLFQPKTRVIAGLRFDKHLSVFAGAGLAVQTNIYGYGRETGVGFMPEFCGGVEL